LWISWIQLLVALSNAIYFYILYKRAKLVPPSLVLFCIVDALTAPVNIWIAIEGSDLAINSGLIISWVFTVAEVIFLPTFLSNLISKKYNPTLPLIIIVIAPFLLKYLFKLDYYSPALNYFLSGTLISFHCYRVILYILSPNSANKHINGTNRMLVFGIMICYVTSIPFSISLIAQLLLYHFYHVYISSVWVEVAFLVGNIIQHIFFFIPYRWRLQRQPL